MTDLSKDFKAATYTVVLHENTNGPSYQGYYNGMLYLMHKCGVYGNPTQPGVRRGSFNAIDKGTGVADIYVSDPALLAELTPEACAFIKRGPELKPSGAMGG